MLIEIEGGALKKACMEVIETIFICLPNAFKGTVYRVGKIPELNVERITSGAIDDKGNIIWGLPSESGYDFPGRPWVDFRDQPLRPLEAMAWCIEKQKSWTAEDPSNDSRSVRLQVKVGLEDFQHMEPVLVRKKDLNLDMYSLTEYPRTYDGNVLWRDSEYVVVAVIKIHFRPYTIKMNSHETRVIKKLSRALGTELLSYQLHQDTMNAIQDMTRDRLNACNILADSLRNAITKTGLIFSLVKQEIGHLREQWEKLLIEECDKTDWKGDSIGKLNSFLNQIGKEHKDLYNILQDTHARFLKSSFSPIQGERWVMMQIEKRWDDLLKRNKLENEKKEKIKQAIGNLKQSLRFGNDPEIIGGYKKLPDDIKKRWVELIYNENESFNSAILDNLIEILDNPILEIPSREKSRKMLIQLKALAETMNQLERNTNFLLHQVLNGNGNKGMSKNVLNLIKQNSEKKEFNFSHISN